MASINIENAQIKTASVEIKTITINGKQLTLSVFRQILHEDIFDAETITLKGTPWGLVNYFWKEEYCDHKIHLIWQSGRELRRSILLKVAELEHTTCIANCLSSLSSWIRNTRSYVRSLRDDYQYEFDKVKKEQIRETYVEEHEALDKAVDLFNKNSIAYNKMMESLLNLPQLYIAV